MDKLARFRNMRIGRVGRHLGRKMNQHMQKCTLCKIRKQTDWQIFFWFDSTRHWTRSIRYRWIKKKKWYYKIIRWTQTKTAKTDPAIKMRFAIPQGKCKQHTEHIENTKKNLPKSVFFGAAKAPPCTACQVAVSTSTQVKVCCFQRTWPWTATATVPSPLWQRRRRRMWLGPETQQTQGTQWLLNRRG